MLIDQFFLNQKVIKSIFVLCFTLITYSLLITHNSPTTGYEASIYTSTPAILWLSLFVSFTFGVLIIIIQIFTGKFRTCNLWQIGVFLIFMVYIISLAIYIIRGYYLWNMSGDPASHIDYINYIIAKGQIPYRDFYPILHVYVSEFNIISNIDLTLLYKFIPLLYGILFVPFMYIAAKSIKFDKEELILVFIVSCTFICGWYISLTPNHLANLYFPLSIYLLVKVFRTKSQSFEILIIICSILYPIFHQVPAIIFATLIISFGFNKNLLRILGIKSDYNISKFKMPLFLFIIVWSISWISDFYMWDIAVKNTYTIITEGGDPHLLNLESKVNFAQNYGYSVPWQITKTMGGTLLSLVFAILSTPLIFKEIGKSEKINNLFLFLSSIFILVMCMLIFFFLSLPFGPLRIMFYLSVFCIFFVGFFIHHFLVNTKSLKQKSIVTCRIGIVIFILILLFSNGLLSLYPSPYTLSNNYQTTLSEVKSMYWLFYNQDYENKITTIRIDQARFASLLLTAEERAVRKIPWKLPENLKIPYHFGNETNLSSYYENEVYLVITERDKSTYNDVFPERSKDEWNSSDFNKLEHEISVNKLYSNHEVNIFYIGQ